MASRLAVQAAAGAKREGLFGGKARQFYLEVSPCSNPACSLDMALTAVSAGPPHIKIRFFSHEQQLRQLQEPGLSMQAVQHTQLLQQMPPQLLPYPHYGLSEMP
jgi:hypothetical protein